MINNNNHGKLSLIQFKNAANPVASPKAAGWFSFTVGVGEGLTLAEGLGDGLTLAPVATPATLPFPPVLFEPV